MFLILQNCVTITKEHRTAFESSALKAKNTLDSLPVKYKDPFIDLESEIKLMTPDFDYLSKKVVADKSYFVYFSSTPERIIEHSIALRSKLLSLVSRFIPETIPVDFQKGKPSAIRKKEWGNTLFESRKNAYYFDRFSDQLVGFIEEELKTANKHTEIAVSVITTALKLYGASTNQSEVFQSISDVIKKKSIESKDMKVFSEALSKGIIAKKEKDLDKKMKLYSDFFSLNRSNASLGPLNAAVETKFKDDKQKIQDSKRIIQEIAMQMFLTAADQNNTSDEPVLYFTEYQKNL
ncbi:hypothetical protein CH379_004690 [Leptospira ellisii]|uniref:Uncharacterized protein n=1 Tax=Leptospira ellisii TaxID=2023197 RepID=A0A2N0B8T6_9LEPT|nr:hypothetical protein [Leptospira ellisii]MDV6234924.1 hypothetical protein [Leptospira ellisii]PJZ92962.1 hypothetical protein CH379_10355 [Leptospira ellisii]PKA04274.1 hypothetical protein CH375_11990 [Leptospira ellisii]